MEQLVVFEAYHLRRDNILVRSFNTSNEAYIHLQKIQGQSADHAMKYEGYSIKRVAVICDETCFPG